MTARPLNQAPAFRALAEAMAKRAKELGRELTQEEFDKMFGLESDALVQASLDLAAERGDE